MKKPEPKPRTRPRAKRIATTGGQFVISEELWALMESLLPGHQNTHRFSGGRPRVSDRACADGIFFVLRTGCQWDALSATGICPSSTAHDHFQRWVEDGFFQRFWQAGLAEYDAFNGIDWSWLSTAVSMCCRFWLPMKASAAEATAAAIGSAADGMPSPLSGRRCQKCCAFSPGYWNDSGRIIRRGGRRVSERRRLGCVL